MDKIAEFFKEFKDRLSNPLFVSFIIAWLIYNWKIVIGLTMYKTSDLCLDGYNSYIDLILRNYSYKKLFCIPFFWALVYTFIYPFIKNSILSFDSWIRTWGEKWIFSITKEGKVSMEKYLAFRKSSEDLVKTLEELIDKENEYKTQNLELSQKNLQYQSEAITLNDKIAKWENGNDVSVLNGDWHFSRILQPGNINIQNVYIENGLIYNYIDDLRNKNKYGDIGDFHYNFNKNTIAFTITIKNKNSFISNFYTLYTDQAINKLTGLEDKKIEIVFTKES